jgi:hypothetical protein
VHHFARRGHTPRATARKLSEFFVGIFETLLAILLGLRDVAFLILTLLLTFLCVECVYSFISSKRRKKHLGSCRAFPICNEVHVP